MLLSHILHDHSPWMLLLAVVVCGLGSKTGIQLWNRALHAKGRSRIDWAFLAAVNLGATIWSTHFVSMLGYGPSGQASFDVTLTSFSISVAILGMGCAIALTLFDTGPISRVLSGAMVGAAISLMHFTGMMGLQIGIPITLANLWAPDAVMAGIVFGILAVLLLDTVRVSRYKGYMAACAFTLSVAGVHFIAMAVFNERMSGDLHLHGATGHTGLAIAVSLVAMILIGTGVSTRVMQERQSILADAQLRQSALLDPLTGTANRGGFNRIMTDLCQRYIAGGPGFVLVVVDLDRFKPVNDVFGHLVGDEILRRVVSRLRAILRPEDVVARLGGDEFSVILTGIDIDDPAVDNAANRIVDLLARPFLIDTRVVEIGASLGLAGPLTNADADPVTLCRNADMALYAAKKAGRSTWRRFEPQIALLFEERRHLEYDLRRAISRDEFELFFQPVVDSGTGLFVGAEALLRWRHPTRGLLSPDVFVTLAEELGLVIPIGKWVIETACKMAMTWAKPLKVSVNVSPMQIRDPRIIQTIRDALQKSGLPPSRLDIEITESALLENEERGIEILGKIQQIGVSISLDDFGTGFSSLSYLHRFPLDRLKIDRSFVDAAKLDPKSERIVEAISNLGTALGLGVTAEGVETREQFAMVAKTGCDIIQGYLISKPIGSEDFCQMITTPGYDLGTPTLRTQA